MNLLSTWNVLGKFNLFVYFRKRLAKSLEQRIRFYAAIFQDSDLNSSLPG